MGAVVDSAKVRALRYEEISIEKFDQSLKRRGKSVPKLEKVGNPVPNFGQSCFHTYRSE